MGNRILVIGSLNMDLVVRAPRHPQVGETIIGSEFSTFPGGKGANQAVAAARLGAPVTMIGKVGADAFGAELLQTAVRDGLDVQWIGRDPGAATGVALITVSESGQNTIVVASGANARLTPADLDAAKAAFGEAAVVLLQLESPLDVVQHAVELARAQGVPVILNPAPAQPLPDELLRMVDTLMPNQTELLQISGQPDLESAVQVLLDLGVRQLIVTLGEEGALLAAGQTREKLPAFKVTAVDTVAAGDAFVGAYATARAEGKNTSEAARFASAAAAISVTRVGAQPSLPTREEVEQFLKENHG